MEGLPRINDLVRFDDPWFYGGTGTVVEVQVSPHQAVLVDIKTMDDEKHKIWVGRKTWILPGHLTVQPTGRSRR